MSYLLDTNAVSVLLRRHKQAIRHFRSRVQAGVSVSSVVLAEVWSGLLRAPDRDGLSAAFTRFGFDVLPFDAADARCAGEVAAQLWASGQPIGPYDTLIAGQALARDLTLVTHNTREFARVPGLRLEDWEL